MRTVREAVRYPSTSDDWIRTVLIGGILSLLGFLLVPVVLVSGYLVSVIRQSRLEGQGPPPFTDWGRLLVDGAQAFVIGFVYMLVPLIVATATIGTSLLAILTGTEIGFATGVGGLVLGTVATGLLAIVFGYVAVAGIVHFTFEERLGAAFELGTLKPILFHRDYALAWVLSILVLAAGGLINGLLAEIGVIGTVAGAFVGFYAAMVAAVLWSDGFVAGSERPDTVDTRPVDELPPEKWRQEIK